MAQPSSTRRLNKRKNKETASGEGATRRVSRRREGVVEARTLPIGSSCGFARALSALDTRARALVLRSARLPGVGLSGPIGRVRASAPIRLVPQLSFSRVGRFQMLVSPVLRLAARESEIRRPRVRSARWAIFS